MVVRILAPVQSILCPTRKKKGCTPASATNRGQYDLPASRGPTRQPVPASRRGINSPPARPPSAALPTPTVPSAPHQSTRARHRHGHGHGHHLSPPPPTTPVALRGRQHGLGAWRRRGRRRGRRRRGRGRRRRGEAEPAGAGAGGDQAVVPGAGVRGHAGGGRVPLLHAVERGVPGAGHAVRRRGLPRHRHDALPQRRQRDLRRPRPLQRLPLRLHARLRRVRAHHARRVRHLLRRRARPHRARRRRRRPGNKRRRAGGGQAEQHKWQPLGATSSRRAGAVGDGPLDGVDAAEREHPRRQHTPHRRALLPLRLRGHRHRGRRDEGGRVEGAVDDKPAQGVRGGGHGHRAAADAAQPAAALLLRLRLRLRRLQPRRRRHRHRHRRHRAGRRRRLDLRRLHGPRHRHLHLRLRQPPPLQGVHAPAARRRRHAPRPLARRRARRRRHRRRHDMGHLI